MICASAIGALVLGFFIWWKYAAPPTSRYEPVIALLQEDKLPMDRPGHIDLAKRFPGLTPHDEMMATRRPDGSLLAMFPTRYGKGSEINGLLYTSRKLSEEDTFFRSSPLHMSDRLIEVGTYSALLIDDRVDEHWYHVSYHIR